MKFLDKAGIDDVVVICFTDGYTCIYIYIYIYIFRERERERER